MPPVDKINNLFRLAGGAGLPLHTGDGQCPAGMTRCNPEKQACPDKDGELDIRTVDGALCRDAKLTKKMGIKEREALTTGVRELMRQMVVINDLNSALDDIMQKDAEMVDTQGDDQVLARASDQLAEFRPDSLFYGEEDPDSTPDEDRDDDMFGAPLRRGGLGDILLRGHSPPKPTYAPPRPPSEDSEDLL
jgi:hypothetical protein